ncbi:MAG: TlyA family RNA methyltransferase [Candidatus Muiribacteriota bacterium]
MKNRLDQILVDRGFFDSRSQAKASILAGRVFSDKKKLVKAGEKFRGDIKIEIKERFPYVSRGALKLKKAHEYFGLNFKNKTAMDAGASTGGFTDYMIQNGIKKVYAVDVGYGQLHYKLRNSPEVVNIEKTNVRYLNEENLYGKIDIITADLSFISITRVYENLRKYVYDGGEFVFLVKPQFEAEKEMIEKKGKVRNPETHFFVLNKMLNFFSKKNDFIVDITPSAIRGAKSKNIEYLFYIIKNKTGDNRKEMEKKIEELKKQL